MRLADISQQGDNLETLKALRQKVAQAIDSTKSGRDLASLSRQLQIILDRIREIEDSQEDDEIKAILDDQGISPARWKKARLQHELMEDLPEDDE